MEPRIQLGNKSIVVGQPVSARWLGQWYEGKVLKLGKKKNLFKVKESVTGECILLEEQQLKPIDRDLPTHQQLDPGAEVAYYDNDINNWISGAIQENDALGMLFVRWSKFPDSAASENWFSFDDTAPVAPKPTSATTNQRNLLPRHSWIDTLEENPRHVANEAFQDESWSSRHQSPFHNKLPSFTQPDQRKDNSLVQPQRTSMSMKSHYASVAPPTSKRKARHHRRSLPDQVNHLYNHMAQQKGKLDHSELAPVWSYLGQAKGIPPHPSSAFYKRMKQSMYRPAASSLQRTPGVFQGAQMRRAMSDVFPGAISHSPTGLSNPRSEPYHYAEVTISSSPSGPQASSTHAPLHGSDMSQRPLPALPSSHLSSTYEVPLPSTHPSRVDIHAGLLGLPEVEEQTQSGTYSEIQSRAPHIESSSPSQISMRLGGSTLLTCRVAGAVPMKYEWERNGKKLTNNDVRIAFPSLGTLQLYGITNNDAGVYKCSASNDYGTVSCAYRLKVTKGSPMKQQSPQGSLESSMEEGGEETLKPAQQEPKSIPGEFMEQTPRYDDYPMDLSHPMPQIPTVIAQTFQQHGEKSQKETNRASKKVEERKTKKNKRKRVSTVLHNDMDSYLMGYGADYGAEPNDSDLLALPSMEQTLPDSHQARSKPRKGFLTSIMGAGDRLTTSKSAHVLKEKASSNKGELETSKSASALTEKRVKGPPFSKNTSHSHNGDNINSREPAATGDQEDRRAVTGRRLIEVVPVRDIVIHPVRENGFDQLTHSYESNSDEDVEVLLEPPGNAKRPETVYTLDTRDKTSPVRTAVQEMDIVDGYPAMEPVKKHASFLPAKSEDSMDARLSRESLISDDNSFASSGRDEYGKRDLPQETAHYTESVRRLQDAHSAYQEEHFGKKKTSKHKLGGWFKSKQDKRSKITMI